MKKVELLSPVGDIKTIPFAVHNGCDAVYFAGKKFGARKFANNFDSEEIIKAIKYCHLYGVKVYITVNTLIFNEEIDEVLDYIGFLYNSGVDALIMQDIGLISKTHELYPDLDIHISTQCHNHNKSGLDFFEKLGATRIVLDREMSLDEIKKLKTNLEKEVFVHGALCVSYSGCCLFSSMNGGRSGNRGECVASCRLPYELYKNDKKISTDGEYLLSTRELNTLSRIKELIEAGITSFKIEGRMKSSEYVGYVTKLYRTMIDKYYNNEEMILDEKDLYNLKKLFNREFTEGYLFNNFDHNLVNIKTPNHQGVKIGEVLDFNKKYIKILLNDYLSQGDGIRLPNNEGMIVNRLYNKDLLLVNNIKKDSVAYIDNKINLRKKGIVLKTIDKKLLDDLRKIEEIKIPIDIEIICKKNMPIKLIVSDNKNTVEKTFSLIEEAQSSPTNIDRIINQISKLGNTPFKINKITTSIDENIFVSIKDLNEIRRMAIDELINIRENSKKRKEIKLENKKNDNFPKKDNDIRINVLVRNEEQLKTCLKNNVDIIYTDDIKLYNNYKNMANIYLRLPRVMLNHPNYENENLLITEIGSLEKYYLNNNVIADYTINAINTETIKLINTKAKFVTISPEVSKNHLINMNFDDYNVEYLAYGTIELMIMKHCPIKLLENNDNDNCNLCNFNNKYYLKDKNNNKFPILNTKHFTHIMHKEPINNIDNIKLCLEKGIKNYRIELLYENGSQLDQLIKKIRNELIING